MTAVAASPTRTPKRIPFQALDPRHIHPYPKAQQRRACDRPTHGRSRQLSSTPEDTASSVDRLGSLPAAMAGSLASVGLAAPQDAPTTTARAGRRRRQHPPPSQASRQVLKGKETRRTRSAAPSLSRVRSVADRGDIGSVRPDCDTEHRADPEQEITVSVTGASSDEPLFIFQPIVMVRPRGCHRALRDTGYLFVSEPADSFASIPDTAMATTTFDGKEKTSCTSALVRVWAPVTVVARG
jgi:hypothetical protein